jgi:hypothetical protein
MKTLINALLMLVFFLLGLRMSGVVSKFAPFLVGSNQSSEVVIPNANENHENMPHEAQDAANMDQHNPQAAPESIDPALAANPQVPVSQDPAQPTPEAQNNAPQTAPVAPSQPTAVVAAPVAAVQKVETAVSVSPAQVKAEVKKSVSTKSSSEKK